MPGGAPRRYLLKVYIRDPETRSFKSVDGYVYVKRTGEIVSEDEYWESFD